MVFETITAARLFERRPSAAQTTPISSANVSCEDDTPDDLHLTERYAQLLSCGGHEWLISRKDEEAKCRYASVARVRARHHHSIVKPPWSTMRVLLPCEFGMSQSAAFACVGHAHDTLAAIGNGKNGLVLRTMRIASDSEEAWPATNWSLPHLVLSSNPSHSGCVDVRKRPAPGGGGKAKVDESTHPCPYDGRSWLVRWRGRLWLYVRANAAAEGGARHVHVTSIPENDPRLQAGASSGGTSIEGAWPRLQLINISGVPICPMNNIYFFAVFPWGGNSGGGSQFGHEREKILALFPAVFGSSEGGLFASSSHDGLTWTTPHKLLSSEVYWPRTTDYPVHLALSRALPLAAADPRNAKELKGAAEEVDLVVQHNVSIFLLLRANATTQWNLSAGTYTIRRPTFCRYRIRKGALLGGNEAEPWSAFGCTKMADRDKDVGLFGQPIAFTVPGATSVLVPKGTTGKEQIEVISRGEQDCLLLWFLQSTVLDMGSKVTAT